MNGWHFFSFAFYFVFCNHILKRLILYFLYSNEMEVEVNAKEFKKQTIIWENPLTSKKKKKYWENPHMNGWYFFSSSSHFTLLNYVSRFDLTFTNTENYYPLNLRGYDSKEKFSPGRIETPFASASNDRQLQRNRYMPILLSLHLWVL